MHKRDFFLCESCELSFVDRNQLISLKVEKSRYDCHENSVRTPGYEAFLRRIIDPLLKVLSPTSHGLDYGCGPYPMLIEILEEEGFLNILGYDPIYCPKTIPENEKYDFITLCEVIEHMNDPFLEINRISTMLKQGSYLFVSTGLKYEGLNIENWHYIKDDTHVNLFSLKTFEWVEEKWGLRLLSKQKDLVIFSKI